MFFELISNSKAFHIYSNSKKFLKPHMSSCPLRKGILLSTEEYHIQPRLQPSWVFIKLLLEACYTTANLLISKAETNFNL